jgi:diguanylate cyclase (GGDEF)-like protein
MRPAKGLQGNRLNAGGRWIILACAIAFAAVLGVGLSDWTLHQSAVEAGVIGGLVALVPVALAAVAFRVLGRRSPQHEGAEREAAERALARARSEAEARILEVEKLHRQLEDQAAEAVCMAGELSEVKTQLSDAVESISEGFALWDANDVLIMCNSRYRHIYPSLIDKLVPGMRFEDFIRAGYERDVFEHEAGEIEALIRERVSRHRISVNAFEQRLADGRWVRISKRRTEAGHIVGIATDISERKDAEAAIQRMALVDSVTELPNRTQFQQKLDEAVAQADRTGRLVGLMLLDLDHFKHINDTFGHPSGDELLKMAAERLLDCARKTETVARLGGDEFAVIVTNSEDPEGILVLAQRMLNSLAEPFMLDGREVHSGTSVGITIYPQEKGGTDQLLRNADLALYRAKEEGRGTCRLYDESMDTQVKARRAIEDDLRHVLERDELHLVYQPQFDVATGEIIGAEALLRWTHPERGAISPAEFIPVAEATGLIIPISDWVLRIVCAQARAWHDAGLPPAAVSANVSVLQFKQQGFVEQVTQVLEESGLEPHWLELEITESMAMAGGDQTKAILDGLKRIGIQLAIDDFGTGYSSLSRLKEFPVDRLKIDRSFVRDITTDWNDAAISSAVIRLGHSLGIKVIAEGVETEGQLEFLVDQGCDEMQGFLFSRPIPAEDFARFLSDHDAAACRKLMHPPVNPEDAAGHRLTDRLDGEKPNKAVG